MEVNSINCGPRTNNNVQKSLQPSFGYVKLPSGSSEGFAGAKDSSNNLEKKYEMACRLLAIQNQAMVNMQNKAK